MQALDVWKNMYWRYVYLLWAKPTLITLYPKHTITEWQLILTQYIFNYLVIFFKVVNTVFRSIVCSSVAIKNCAYLCRNIFIKQILLYGYNISPFYLNIPFYDPISLYWRIFSSTVRIYAQCIKTEVSWAPLFFKASSDAHKLFIGRWQERKVCIKRQILSMTSDFVRSVILQVGQSCSKKCIWPSQYRTCASKLDKFCLLLADVSDLIAINSCRL